MGKNILIIYKIKFEKKIKHIQMNHQKVIEFWFQRNEFRKFWFQKNIEIDLYIKNEFGYLLKQAENNQLNSWKNDPKGFLALVILLDQFSRNIYRDDELKIKKNDKICLQLCKEIINLKIDLELDFSQKAFLLLPFRHTKDIYNIFYCIKKMIFYKDKEKMDKKKFIIFNKFVNASIKDIKCALIKKNFIV